MGRDPSPHRRGGPILRAPPTATTSRSMGSLGGIRERRSLTAPALFDSTIRAPGGVGIRTVRRSSGPGPAGFVRTGGWAYRHRREVRGRPIDGRSRRTRRRLEPDAHRPRQTGTIRTEHRPANERGDAAEHGGPHARRHEPRHDPLCGEHQLGHSRGPLRRAGPTTGTGAIWITRETRARPSVGLVPSGADGLCSTADDAHAPPTGRAGPPSPIRVSRPSARSDRSDGPQEPA